MESVKNVRHFFGRPSGSAIVHGDAGRTVTAPACNRDLRFRIPDRIFDQIGSDDLPILRICTNEERLIARDEGQLYGGVALVFNVAPGT
jgi:hypothetical protein